MISKLHHKISTAVLLILTLVLLVATSVAVVFAADPEETRNLSVKFDSQLCAVTYSINGVEKGALQSEKLVQLPYRSENVKISVTPMPGYELKAIYKVAADGSETLQQIDMQDRSYLHDFFNEDVTLRVECEPKTYNVVFAPVEGESSISYNFLTDTPEKYQNNLTYTYRGAAVEIDPVEKRSQGYTFVKWQVVNLKADGTYEAISTLPVDANNKLIIPSETTILEQWQATGTIYLRPIFQALEYDVYRYDHIVKFNPANPDVPILSGWLNEGNVPSWKAPMASEASGKWEDGEISPYPGYRFYGFTTVKVDIDSNKNNVYRYFVPIEYALTFDWNGGSLLSGTEAQYHVYDAETALPKGQRTGYTFAGWVVLVNGNEVERVTNLDALVLSAKQQKYTENNDGEDARKITLKAIWTPNRYPIVYNFAGAKPEDNTALPTAFVFNENLTIPTPVRPGYSFVGWTVNGSEWKPAADAPMLVLQAEQYTAEITLVAHWEAIEYTVTLDGKGGSPATQTLKVTFGQELKTDGISLPIRAQYKFLGFYYGDKQYIAADGKSVCDAWDIAEALPTLEARWELLPMMEVNIDDYKVNYPKELFVFPNGSYTILLGEEKISFVVTDNKPHAIPDAFFGNTVQLVVHSDGVVYSDYHGTLTLAKRPDAPVWSTSGQIASIDAPNDTSLKVTMNAGIDLSLFEFALAISGESTMMRDWQASPEFLDLYPGTPYEVYVRFKATETAPSGVIAAFPAKTDSMAFVNELIAELENMIRQDDGEMLRKLISDAQTAIQQLKPQTATFYADAEKIMSDTEAAVPFARLQDEKIALLRAYRDALIATGAYTQENAQLLRTLCDTAVDAIKLAGDEAAVKNVYDTAYANMSAVKITYLVNGPLHLTAPGGLHKDTALIGVRYPDISTQIQNFNNAIAAAKVTFNGSGMTPAELLQLLNTQEVIAAYSLKLSIDGAILSDVEGGVTVKLLLPEELRSIRGLRVAYYDATTGALLVLETRAEGDYLVFEAENVKDFLILGDPVLNLTAPIVALSIVALCQIVAIALILISRSKAKNAVRNYAVWLPTALTVQFLPHNGEIMVLCLGILVVLLQIALLVLLFSSEMIHKSLLDRRSRRAKREELPADTSAYADLSNTETAPAEEAIEETEAEDPEPEETDAADAAAFVAISETLEVEEDAESYLDGEENFLTGEESEEDPLSTAFDLDTEEGVYDTEEAYDIDALTEDGEALPEEDGDGYYDFIEPAPATEYSLPDAEYPSYEDEAVAEDTVAEDDAFYYGEQDGEQPLEISPEELTYEDEQMSEYADEQEPGEAAEQVWDDPYADAEGYEAQTYYEDDPADFAQGEAAPYEEEYPAYDENAVYDGEAPVYDENSVYDENAEYGEDVVYDENVEYAEDAVYEDEAPADGEDEEYPRPQN